MSDTTFTEAKRCPKCEQPGSEITQRRGPSGSKIFVIECKNQRCRWYETSYIVQVNADGTIPSNSNRQKSFPQLPTRSDEDIEKWSNNLYRQTIGR